MKIDVKKVAKLANLPLSGEEEEKYSQQLSKILDYIEHLNKVDTLRHGSGQASDVKPTFNPSTTLRTSSVMREDEVGESLLQDEALLNAPKKKDGFIITKGVFEE